MNHPPRRLGGCHPTIKKAGETPAVQHANTKWRAWPALQKNPGLTAGAKKRGAQARATGGKEPVNGYIFFLCPITSAIWSSRVLTGKSIGSTILHMAKVLYFDATAKSPKNGAKTTPMPQNQGGKGLLTLASTLTKFSCFLCA
jgi:hypothetical protein